MERRETGLDALKAARISIALACAALVLFALIPTASAVHWVTGNVTDAPEGQNSSDRTVTVYVNTGSELSNTTYDHQADFSKWMIDVANLPGGWSNGETLNIKVLSPWGTNNTTLVLSDSAGSQQAPNLTLIGRPTNWPDIMDYTSRRSRMSANVLRLLEIITDTVTSSDETNRNKTYDYIMGGSYFAFAKMSQVLRTTQDNEGLSNKLNSSVNRSMSAIPEFMGEPSGADGGVSYILNHSARGRAGDLNNTLNRSADLLVSSLTLFSQILDRIDDALGFVDRAAHPVW